MSTKTVEAYVCKAPKAKLELGTVELPPLQPHDIEIKVEYCGVCHSDLALVNCELGPALSVYPLVPGHELVGTITEVGCRVTHLKAGMRVGVGWQRGCCNSCSYCLSGQQNLCHKQTPTCGAGFAGGWAKYHRTPAMLAFKLPDAMDPAVAGPLFCGGVTTFSPFVQYVKPTDKVAIMGVGGLGHMALQWAHAWGCEVTALSTSVDKEKECRSLGAHNFGLVNDPKWLEAHQGCFDFILHTAPHQFDSNTILPLLSGTGKICLVAPTMVEFHSALLFAGASKAVVGSNTGTVHNMELMLDFAVRHNVKPTCEVYEFNKVNEVLERMAANKIRYRAVLKW
eukprot:TRINITY_DN6152_c0_g1_i1.p2 TRINITY_DN6152_c0_g1~~TRINITY_DN6152_c0_g1_i1.p2  ORF type:complete len:346 (-),score=98.79 TRINITY_DN6152_c0_g1_i1:65-1081(-)